MQTDISKKLLVCVLLVVMTAGCAGRGQPQADAVNGQSSINQTDPWEGYNRSIYAFNETLDNYVLRPTAKAYQKITPQPVETGIYNFFENLQEPLNILNSLLQGKIHFAGTSAGRLVLNSTVGLLGFIDVATKLDIRKHREDFGQTLAQWGVPSGPYVVLPIFGPRYLRHTAGMVPDFILGSFYSLSDESVRYGLLALGIVQTRARFLSTDDLLALQLDPYIFVRETYLQLREGSLKDLDRSTGRPTNTEDEFNDEFEEDFEEFDEDEIKPQSGG